MPLPGVLSAIRELIIHDVELPRDRDARRVELAQRFDDLSDAELDDLADLPPERIHVYTNLVFAGERQMLRWLFATSLPIIAQIIRGQRAESGDAEPPDDSEILFDLVKEMNAKKRWGSASIRELGKVFADFVREDRPDLVAAWAGLPELIELERIEAAVYYALDADADALDPSALAAGSVDELLAAPVLLPDYVEPRKCKVDVLAAHEHRQETGETIDPLPTGGPSFVACGRDPDSLMPVWVELSQAEFDALNVLKKSKRGDTPARVRIDDLASAYLSAREPNPGDTEESVFLEFFECLTTWCVSGVLLAPRA